MSAPARLSRLVTGVKIVDDWIDMLCSQIERALNVTGSGGVTVQRLATGLNIGYGKAFPFAVAQTGGGGIPARSGTTLGKASVTLYDFKPSTSNLTVNSQSITVNAFNLFTNAIGASHYILMLNWNGYWIVVAEDCP